MAISTIAKSEIQQAVLKSVAVIRSSATSAYFENTRERGFHNVDGAHRVTKGADPGGHGDGPVVVIHVHREQHLRVRLLLVTHEPDLDHVLVDDRGDDDGPEKALGKVVRQFPLAAVLERGPGGPLPDVVELPVEGAHGHALPGVGVRLYHPSPVGLRLGLEADCLVHLALVEKVLETSDIVQSILTST